MTCPVKPPSRPENASIWARIRLFRKDLFSSQPERLYRARMAEQRGPGYRSFLINQPDLVQEVLSASPDRFPKARIVNETVGRALGQSIFTTNGDDWRRARSLIEGEFSAAKLERHFPAILGAANSFVERLVTGTTDIEPECSRATADAILRVLFGSVNGHPDASFYWEAFRSYQESQPFWSLMHLLRLPNWIAGAFPLRASGPARRIRERVRATVQAALQDQSDKPHSGGVLLNLASQRDAEGNLLSTDEIVDQMTLLILAGHESSAAALGWALYLLAWDPVAQAKARAEIAALSDKPSLSEIRNLRYLRDVFREALRLYPPVPMLLREAAQPETFRAREVRPGAMVILSPWHLHRHQHVWSRPDEFDPDRWQTDQGKRCAKDAFIPFSSGPRSCVGQGFAMVEGVTMLALLLRQFEFSLVDGQEPRPVARLTVRSSNGIHLSLRRVGESGQGQTAG